MKVFRGIFLASLVAGFAALFVALNPGPRPTEEGDKGAEIETEGDILVEGLRFSEWEEDRRVWSMDAKRSRYDYDGQKATLDQVGVTFFPPEGAKMHLRADRIDYDLETRRLAARGDVQGKSDQGYVFSTESLLYDSDARVVSTSDQVTLEKDRLTIQGRGMEGSLADHRFRLMTAVRAVFVPRGILR